MTEWYGEFEFLDGETMMWIIVVAIGFVVGLAVWAVLAELGRILFKIHSHPHS